MRPLLIATLLVATGAQLSAATHDEAGAPPRWAYKETLVVEDMVASPHTTKTPSPYRQLSRDKDPFVFVNMQIGGTARYTHRGDGEEGSQQRRRLLSLLPEGVASLFEPIAGNEGGDSSAAVHLRDFDWGMCGGRYKPEWPFVRPSASASNATAAAGSNGASDYVQQSLYRHQNHVTCGMSAVSSCYASAASERASSTPSTLCDDSEVRSHHRKLLRHWGRFVGSSNGIGGSVGDIHDRYTRGRGAAASPSQTKAIDGERATPNSPVEVGAASWLGAAATTALEGYIRPLFYSDYFRPAASFDMATTTAVEKRGHAYAATQQAHEDAETAASTPSLIDTLMNYDISTMTGGTTSGNRLIAVHKRPFGAHSPPSLKVSRQPSPHCFHDLSVMERLCTENLLPMLYVWEELVQLSASDEADKSGPVKASHGGLAVKRRLRQDEWSVAAGAPNRGRRSSTKVTHSPSARLSIIDAAVPDATFVLSTGYHAVAIKAAVRNVADADYTTGRAAVTELSVSIELTFVLSTDEEVTTFTKFLAQRSRELAHLNKMSHVSLLGNALVRGNASSAAPASFTLKTTKEPPKQLPPPATEASDPSCTVDGASVQHGEVDGELRILIRCDGRRHNATRQEAIVESLIMLPAHTVNPIFSSMALTVDDASLAGATASVVRLWYDPLSTVTSCIVRTTLPLSAVSASATITVPYRFPSLRLDQYPPDMNKAYGIPQLVSRVRLAPTDDDKEGLVGAAQKEAIGQNRYEVPHQAAIEALMDGGVSLSDAADTDRTAAWVYQRSSTVSTVTLPLPDPGMVFNVLSLSSALLALLIGRGVGIVLKRSVMPAVLAAEE